LHNAGGRRRHAGSVDFVHRPLVGERPPADNLWANVIQWIRIVLDCLSPLHCGGARVGKIRKVNILLCLGSAAGEAERERTHRHGRQPTASA
jgi:hypothetical protein